MTTKPKRSVLHQLFSRKKFRIIQKITRVRRIHHPRWGFGWAFPMTDWVYFEPYTYKVEFVYRADYGQTKIQPGHWERVHAGSYHDSTTSGTY